MTHDSSLCQHQKAWLITTMRQFNVSPMRPRCHQCIPSKFNYDSWLITMSTSKGMTYHDKQCKSSEQLFRNTVQDSLFEHCSRQLIRTIIQEEFKVYYDSTLFHFWRGSGPSSTRSINNSRLSTDVIITKFHFTFHSLSSTCTHLIPYCIL